ncbi:MAG TPA: dihydrofolate reductase family protein [Geminicoccaceae bacterium]|nr:dihydrofolate reductase family protein [Geminicoccaceae bacterium]
MSRPIFTMTAVVSADGYIGRRAGEHPGSWASAAEQTRFLAEVPRYDWAFMGRTTHETAFREDRRRVVFSRAARGLDWRHETHLWVDPNRVPLADIMAALVPVRPPQRCIVLGGTTVHDWFLARDLIDRIELTIEPLRFGGGLALLTGQAGDLTEELVRRGFAVVEQQMLNPEGTWLLVFTPRARRDHVDDPTSVR